MSRKINQLVLKTGNFFGDKIKAGDWKFFRDFASNLKAEVTFRDAAMLKNRSPIHAALLESKLVGIPVNQLQIAEQYNVTKRRVYEINRTIKAPVMPRGRPRK